MLNLQEGHIEQSAMHCEDRCPISATALQVKWVHRLASVPSPELTSSLVARVPHSMTNLTNGKGNFI